MGKGEASHEKGGFRGIETALEETVALVNRLPMFSEYGDGRQKAGECGKAFPWVSQLTGRDPRNQQRYATQASGGDLRQAFSGGDS